MFGDSSSENTDRKQQQLSVVYNATGTENAANFRKAVLGALSAKTTSGELLTALLTGEADASPESLVKFEPREKDYKAAARVFAETKDPIAAIEAGKGKMRSPDDVNPKQAYDFMVLTTSMSKQLFQLLWHNSTEAGRKVFEHLENDVAQAWREICTHAPEMTRPQLKAIADAVISGTFFETSIDPETQVKTYSKWQSNLSWKTNLKNYCSMSTRVHVISCEKPP